MLSGHQNNLMLYYISNASVFYSLKTTTVVTIKQLLSIVVEKLNVNIHFLVTN